MWYLNSSLVFLVFLNLLNMAVVFQIESEEIFAFLVAYLCSNDYKYFVNLCYAFCNNAHG